jgi:hypothetical protein
MLDRVLLWVAGLGFAAFGLAFLIHPLETFALTGLTLNGPIAVAELMAFYGGLELALGALLVACASTPHRLRDGLLLTAVLYGAIAAARAAGMALTGADNAFLRAALAMESALALLAFWRLRARR